MHIRRGDFFHQCQDGQCLIPLPKFKTTVDQIREEVREKLRRNVKEVIVMSDEQDPDFWEEVKRNGWVRLDHSRELTSEKYGEWMGPILDQVAQSMAAGFVGTADSTFSLVGARRVQDWNHGPGILISKDG